ncbi:hypothetical protein [Actinomadura alba]|uniref:Uncharacterized protein n=1 Tax=Actinomadura alba TaxID=406431 RepID=A0ABR7LZ77_9ACTN|nr:hypothetical protein [Actinomadura alba]MBC6470153.1 hypothetical protein [Actinomadura alba]
MPYGVEITLLTQRIVQSAGRSYEAQQFSGFVNVTALIGGLRLVGLDLSITLPTFELEEPGRQRRPCLGEPHGELIEIEAFAVTKGPNRRPHQLANISFADVFSLTLCDLAVFEVGDDKCRFGDVADSAGLRVGGRRATVWTAGGLKCGRYGRAK